MYPRFHLFDVGTERESEQHAVAEYQVVRDARWVLVKHQEGHELAIEDEFRAFNAGQQGTDSITVSNVGTAATSGTVTVNDTLPGGLTLYSMSGSNWNCNSPPVCTRTDSLAPGVSFPQIAVVANVSSSASGTVTNMAAVSGGGETNTSNDSATAAVTITGSGGNTLAAIVSPTPGSTLSGSTVTFTWNTGAGVTQYWLAVGTTVGV